HGEDEARPKPPAHVVQLGIALVERDGAGLERHAADGARSGPVPDDLRVHGASPFRARGGWRRRSRLFRTEIPLRIGLEFRLACLAAEADLAAPVDHFP